MCAKGQRSMGPKGQRRTPSRDGRDGQPGPAGSDGQAGTPGIDGLTETPGFRGDPGRATGPKGLHAWSERTPGSKSGGVDLCTQGGGTRPCLELSGYTMREC